MSGATKCSAGDDFSSDPEEEACDLAFLDGVISSAGSSCLVDDAQMTKLQETM